MLHLSLLSLDKELYLVILSIIKTLNERTLTPD